MLSESQIERIHELIALLSIYTNQRFDVVDEEALKPLMEASGEEGLLLMRELMGTTWEHREIIDDFVSENPFGLSRAQLAVVSQWKDALRCQGVFMGIEDGRELYLTEGRLIALEQSEARATGPFLIDFVALPFEGTIIEDFCSIAFDMDLDQQMRRELEQEAADARAAGVICTADELTTFAREVNGRRHEAALEKLLDDVSRESRARAGEDISPEGFHRGELAGLSPEERERRVQEEMERTTNGIDATDHVVRRAVKGAPGGTLAECLMTMTKPQIAQIARMGGAKGYSKLRKKELAEEVAQGLLDGLGDEGSALATMATWAPSTYIEQFRKLAENGDITWAFDEAKKHAFEAFPHPPLTYLYLHNGVFTLHMPQDVRDQLAAVDFEPYLARARERERAVSVAEEATEVYGVVSVEDAFEELNLLGETPLSLEEFREALWMAEPDDLHSIRLWSFEGDDYLVHWELWDETVARDTARDFDIEGVIESVQRDLRPNDYATDGELKVAVEAMLRERLSKGTQVMEEAVAQADDERAFLVRAHRDLPRRKHLYEFDRSGHAFLALFDTPAAQALGAYIDERVPDGAADCFFAEKVVEELLTATVHLNADVPTLLDIACEMGLEGCDDSPARLMGLVSNLRNTLPLWELNGWSAAEHYELLTGKKLFLGPNGLPLKVGRNDPCPCGSGKKYKKCCGR